jgi:hypothetical protein
MLLLALYCVGMLVYSRYCNVTVNTSVNTPYVVETCRVNKDKNRNKFALTVEYTLYKIPSLL